jgi:cobalamin synthase
MWDLSDQFVAEAEVGGLVALVSFIAMISRSYSRLGRMRKQVDRKQQWLFWSLGCVMLAHIFAFFGVSYWDQTQLWWFAFLAMVSAATVALQNAPANGEGADTEDGAVLEPVAEGPHWAPGLHSTEA